MRLFVDCDDTLILFDSEGPHPFGATAYNEPFHFNEPLIAFIRRFRQRNFDDLIIIWSGGGRKYAQTVAEMVGLDDIGAGYLIKDRTTFDLVRKQDIVVDDQKLAVSAVITPPDFFGDAEKWGSLD